MAKVISGKDLSAQLKEEMRLEVATFPEKYGRVPHLVVILVGEDPGSVSYVTGKAKASGGNTDSGDNGDNHKRRKHNTNRCRHAAPKAF